MGKLGVFLIVEGFLLEVGLCGFVVDAAERFFRPMVFACLFVLDECYLCVVFVQWNV